MTSLWPSDLLQDGIWQSRICNNHVFNPAQELLLFISRICDIHAVMQHAVKLESVSNYCFYKCYFSIGANLQEPK